MGMKIFTLFMAIIAVPVAIRELYKASVELVDAATAFKENPEGENTEKKTEESE